MAQIGGRSDSCGVVLAGGRSLRFGSEKPLALFKGEPLVAHGVRSLREIFGRVLVVSRDPGRLDFLKKEDSVELIEDAYPEFHPLGGIHSAMLRSGFESYFVCACDAPLVQKSLIDLCLSAEGWDAAAFRWKSRIEPFPGLYRRSLQGILKEMIAEKNYSLTGLLGRARTRIFSEEEIREADPKGISFLDADFPRDLEKLSHA